MKTTRPFGLLLMAVLTMGLLATSIFLPSPRPVAYAQRPTPTNILPLSAEGEPGAEGPSRTGTVSGIVFNYSTSQPQGGIGVVLDGGGWMLDTVSGPDGHYIFRGLGSGPATLSLRLPEGATPVNPDLLVYTGPNLDVNENLGYYTGSPSPVPVLLTAEHVPVEGVPSQLVLKLQVENRGATDVTGVVVDARLSDGLQILSDQVSQGWADAVGLRAQVHLGNLATGHKANVNLLLKLTSPQKASEKGMRATLTYDQQMTSQIAALVTSSSADNKMPITGEATAQNSLSYSLLAIFFVIVFGYAAVLMARLRVKKHTS